MGRKVHPYGFRVGVYKDWQSKWFAERGYADLVAEDLKLRNVILGALPAFRRSWWTATRTRSR